MSNTLLDVDVLKKENKITKYSQLIAESAEKINNTEGIDYERTGQELLSRKTEFIPTLIEPLLMKQGLIGLVGASESGKSTFLRLLALHIVSNQPHFLGYKINATHHSVIYVSSEDDEVSISYLLNKQNKELNLKPIEIAGLRYIFETADLDKKLEKSLQKRCADAIIIDAFADVYGGDMHRSNEVRSYLEKFSNLAKKYQCLIIFLHHINKGTELLKPSKNNITGTQGFEAKLRLIIELRADLNNPDLRHLCIIKANYLSKEYKLRSYVLNFNENMIFHNTGERTDFDDLAECKPINNEKPNYKEIAENVFNNNPILNKEAIEKIANITSKSEPTAKRYFSEILKLELIKNIGTNTKPEYIFNS